MIGAFEQLHNREKEKKTLLLSNIYNSLSHLKITLNNDIFYLENSHCNSLHFNLNSSILFNFFKINIIKMLLEETMTSSGISHFEEPYVTLVMFFIPSKSLKENILSLSLLLT
jgi:hypothetical protein